MAAVDFDDEFDVGSDGHNDELNQMILELSSSLALSNLAALHLVNAYDVPQAGFVSLWAEQPDKIEKNLFEAEYRKRRYKMDILMDNLKHTLGTESFEYLAPHTHIVKGTPGRELPKLADSIKADLVVMGTIARTGIAGMIIGNTAENVLSQLQCSVLAIKPKAFVSPVS